MIKQIIEEYKKGKSRYAIESEYGIESHKMKSILEENGVKVRGKKQKKYDEKVFDIIDTEEKAYWLGFLYADGYNGDTLEISLKESDKEHLEKFKRFLRSDIPIAHRTKTKAVRFSMKSKYLQDRLRELGVVRNKSLILTFPKFLSEGLTRHFIRGYFDGDGCISIRSSGKQEGQVRVNLLGTEKFLLDLLEVIQIDCNIHRKSNNKAYHFELFGKKAIEFIDLMYSESSICLHRKGLLANAVLQRDL
jgi:intein/homing endonuclease